MKQQVANLCRNYNPAMVFFKFFGGKRDIKVAPIQNYYDIVMNAIYEAVYDTDIAFMKNVECVQWGYEGIMVYTDVSHFRVSAGMPIMSMETKAGGVCITYGSRHDDDEHCEYPKDDGIQKTSMFSDDKEFTSFISRIVGYMTDKLRTRINIADIMNPGDKYDEYKKKPRKSRKKKGTII